MGQLNTVRRIKSFASLLLILAAVAQPLHAGEGKGPGLYLEEMTSPELRERLAAGATTVLVPIGGTEQGGPHIVLGKHNVRARLLAAKIAQKLGNAVVAPTISYVPEGSITPPAGHMRFTGTISVPDDVFEAVLEATARSFKQHGFRDVVFLGDHGGYQKNEEKVANRLNKEWSSDSRCRVHALLDYYRITHTAFVDELKRRGFQEAEIGTHAGLADTALSLAVDKALVRSELLHGATRWTERDGVHGDPRRASAELGQAGMDQIVDTSVNAIRAFAENHPVQIHFKQK